MIVCCVCVVKPLSPIDVLKAVFLRKPNLGSFRVFGGLSILLTHSRTGVIVTIIPLACFICLTSVSATRPQLFPSMEGSFLLFP